MSNYEKPKFLAGEELDDFYFSTPDPYTMPPPMHLNLGGLIKYAKERLPGAGNGKTVTTPCVGRMLWQFLFCLTYDY